MKIDPGLVIVILAVLVFYLRLIILQRERAKRLPNPRRARKTSGNSTVKSTEQPNSKKSPTDQPTAGMNILSSNRIDWWITGSGVIAIIIGILLYLKVIPIPTMQQYWWIPTAIGIVAFGWAFRL